MVSLVLAFAGCTTETVPDPAPTSASDHQTTNHTAGATSLLRPETALARGCPAYETTANYQSVGLPVGDTAVDFTLRDTGGVEYTLSDLLEEKPVVFEFRSFT